MQTMLVDRADWEELVQAAIRARACLGVVRKMYAEKFLVLSPPEPAEPAEFERMVQEFEIMVDTNRERLDEALVPYEDEV